MVQFCIFPRATHLFLLFSIFRGRKRRRADIFMKIRNFTDFWPFLTILGRFLVIFCIFWTFWGCFSRFLSFLHGMAAGAIVA